MINYLKQNHLSLLIVLFLIGSGFLGQGQSFGNAVDRTTITNPWTFEENITLSSATLTNTGGATTLATTTVESFQTGGAMTVLTDANGGTYTLTEVQMLISGGFEFAAGGAGQEVIALTFPATSTMTSLIPNAGDCRAWTYDADALAAATTTTFTAGTGHHLIAYTTNDDVLDGNEFALVKMCRRTDTDVNTFVSELVHSD